MAVQIINKFGAIFKRVRPHSFQLSAQTVAALLHPERFDGYIAAAVWIYICTYALYTLIHIKHCVRHCFWHQNINTIKLAIIILTTRI